jgi:hypothetical protein
MIKFALPNIGRFFRRNEIDYANEPQMDPRWLALDRKEWTCASCAQSHFGLVDLAIDKPDAWPFGPEVAKYKMHDHLKSYLSDDFCIVNDEYYFVRCVLYLPINEISDAKLGLGLWSSLSKANFLKYRETFNEPNPIQSEPWFGWLANSLKGYPISFELKCNVHLQNKMQRPLIQLELTEHPLTVEHHHGINLDRLFEIYEANGHKIQLPS